MIERIEGELVDCVDVLLLELAHLQGERGSAIVSVFARNAIRGLVSHRIALTLESGRYGKPLSKEGPGRHQAFIARGARSLLRTATDAAAELGVAPRLERAPDSSPLAYPGEVSPEAPEHGATTYRLGKFGSLVDAARLPKKEQAAQLLRRLVGIERAERAKPAPSMNLLTRLADTKRRLEESAPIVQAKPRSSKRRS